MGIRTKHFSTYPGCHKVRSAISECFQSLNKGRMWWYNIIGDYKGSIPHLQRIDHITAGYILLAVKLAALKKGNSEPVLVVKRTEWRKFIDCFGQSIEADPSRVGKNEIHFVHIGYISRPSSIKLHISRHHLGKYFNL